MRTKENSLGQDLFFENLKLILQKQKIPLKEFKELCYKINITEISNKINKQKLIDKIQKLILFLEIQEKSEEKQFLEKSHNKTMSFEKRISNNIIEILEIIA